jgi:transcriptional regulator with XRE-family HTH domain
MADEIPSVDTYLGGHLRAFRIQHGLTQQQAGELMGFPASTAQGSYSNREAPADHPRYTAASLTELAHLEDGAGVLRGTILRAAGLVVCPGDASPREMVSSWIWLDQSERAVVELMIDKALARQASDPPGPAKRRKKIR